MFGTAGKGERKSLRGSVRQSKMPGRLPRLRALRPRPQQQRQRARSDVTAAVAVDTTRRPEGNLKEALVSHEEEEEKEVDVKKCNAKKSENIAMNEMDGDDDEDENHVDDSELTMTVVAGGEEVTPDGEIDVDFAVKSEEMIDLETERASYECKTCNPPRTLSSIKAYFEHLQKEHKYKVRVLSLAISQICLALFCALVFVPFYISDVSFLPQILLFLKWKVA